MLKDPTQFRERFKRWKAGELVYDKGLPKFEGGKDDIAIDGGAPFEITVTGRDRRPAWKRMYQNPNLGDTSQYYNGNILEDAVSFVPGLGDAVDVVKAADAVNRGNYLEAGILGAGLLLPNVIEKPVKAISKLFGKGIKKITKENAAKILPSEWTAAQDAAIAKGDMAEAQRLRDLHFLSKTPDNIITTDWKPYIEERGLPQKLYHGTYNDWNAYDPARFGETDQGFFGKGIYTTRKKAYAETYGDRLKELYAYAKKVLDNKKGSSTSKAIPYFGMDINKTNASQEIKDLLDGVDGVNVWGKNSINGPEHPFEEMVLPLHGKTIKSADAVTFDDKGIRIPLGERDNFKLNDIRYGLLPFVGLGAGYGLYNNYNK